MGIGPGPDDLIPPRARNALAASELVVGYGPYLARIAPLLGAVPTVSTGMTHETQRCRTAVERAAQGAVVSLVSSGDPGIYAMAGLALEIAARTAPDLDVEIIPGITAASAAAAAVGAPLMCDFAAVSLSDRLLPWEVISRRLEAVAAADLVLVLYNPRSKGRTWQLEAARQILLRHRPAHTPVAAVRHAQCSDCAAVHTTLATWDTEAADMHTTIIVGNSATVHLGRWIVTARGYAP